MQKDTCSVGETWEEKSRKIEAKEEQRRLEILLLLLGTVAVISIVGVYGDALWVIENIYWACEDFWELFFPR